MSRDLIRDAAVLLARDDASFDQIGRLTIWPMIDDPPRGGSVDAGKRPEIVRRGAIDIDCAPLLYAFNHPLDDRLGIASGLRCGVSRLLANLIRRGIVWSATRKNESNR